MGKGASCASEGKAFLFKGGEVLLIDPLPSCEASSGCAFSFSNLFRIYSKVPVAII